MQCATSHLLTGCPCPCGSTHPLGLNLAHITCNKISQMFVCDSLEGHEDGELITHHKAQFQDNAYVLASV